MQCDQIITNACVQYIELDIPVLNNLPKITWLISQSGHSNQTVGTEVWAFSLAKIKKAIK